MLGAATNLSRCCEVSVTSTAQRIPCACSSISLTSVSRISGSGAPFAIRSSTRRWLSRSAARVCCSAAYFVILLKSLASPDARAREEQQCHLPAAPRPGHQRQRRRWNHHNHLPLWCECTSVAQPPQLSQERCGLSRSGLLQYLEQSTSGAVCSSSTLVNERPSKIGSAEPARVPSIIWPSRYGVAAAQTSGGALVSNASYFGTCAPMHTEQVADSSLCYLQHGSAKVLHGVALSQGAALGIKMSIPKR